MAVQFIKFEDIDEKIKGEGIKIISFYSDACGPCKMFAPILENLSQQYEIYKISIDKMDKSHVSEIESIPFTKIYNNSKLIQEITGYTTKTKLIEIIEK